MADAGLEPAYHPLTVYIDDVVASTQTVYFTWKSRSGYKVTWNDPKMVWAKCHSAIKTSPTTGLPTPGDKGLLYLSKQWGLQQPPDRVADLPRPKYPLDLGGSESVMPPVDVEIRRLWAMLSVPHAGGRHSGWIELSSPDLVAPGCQLMKWEPGTPVTVELEQAAQNMLGDRLAGGRKKFADADILELWAALNVKTPNPKYQTTDFYTVELTNDTVASLVDSKVFASVSMTSSIAFTDSGLKSLNIDPSDPDFWATDDGLDLLIKVPQGMQPRWPWIDNPDWSLDEIKRVAGGSALASAWARRLHVAKLLRRPDPTKR